MTDHEPIAWIETHLDVKESTAGAFLYGRVDCWSHRRLAGIDVPFDGSDRGHFSMRSQELDFAVSVGSGRILDFGPGDGWPALRVAPMVQEVIGVEASAQRVRVCQENARRVGVDNARFVLVEPGERLPFANETFDGAMASWSLEESPDLQATLTEIHRVLRPGGRLRFERIPLSFFACDNGLPMYIGDALGERTILGIAKADVDRERVRNHGILIDLPRIKFCTVFERHGVEPGYAGLTEGVLRELRPHMVEAAAWTTRNPQCKTWLRWLPELGFSEAHTTYGGGWAGERLFDRLPASRRPTTQAETDEMLRPVVEVIVTMEGPVHLDMPITAVK
jgi:SAM-dependent methyltransferase